VDDLGLLPVSPASEAPITSIYFWGGERREVNYAARILSQQLDPQFRWVEAEIASDGEASPPIPEVGALAMPARKLVPSGGVRPELLWSFLRLHGQQRYGFDVNEFLRLPDAIQVAVGALLARAPPRVLAIANVDLLEEFDATGTGFYGQFIEWLNSHEITLLVTATGEPLLERIDFEYSITLPSGVSDRRRPPLGVCQWGDCTNCLIRELFPSGEIFCLSSETLDSRVPASVRSVLASH